MRRKSFLFVAGCCFFTGLLCSAPWSDQGLLTWERPDFAYYNNQMVMLATVPVFNPTPGRRILPPEIYFPAIQGLSEPKLVPLTSLFEENPLRRHFELVQPTTDCVAQRAWRSRDECLRLTKDSGLWAHLYTRFVVFGVLLGDPRVADVLQSFVYKDPIRALREQALATVDLTKAVGLHIRTFETSVSSISKGCACALWYNPLTYIYKCNAGAQDYEHIVNQFASDKRIFIATDDQQSSTVLRLRAKFGARIVFIQDLVNTTLSHDSFPSIAILESELLAHTEFFVGNAWSTFSTIVHVKRRGRNSFLVLH